MAQERRTICFGGRVQGVGFRMTAVSLARGLGVAGTVRNLPDGRVELSCEGEAGEIDTLVRRLGEHFGSFIRTVEQTSAGTSTEAGPGLRVVD